MKDALGHGSDSRGGEAAHQEGVAQAGRRFHTVIQPYSLEGNKIGQRVGQETVVSRHDSIGMAGNRLGSLIRGKQQDTMRAAAGKDSTGLPNGYRVFVRDTQTGNEYSRTQARAIHQGHWNGAMRTGQHSTHSPVKWNKSGEVLK